MFFVFGMFLLKLAAPETCFSQKLVSVRHKLVSGGKVKSWSGEGIGEGSGEGKSSQLVGS